MQAARRNFLKNATLLVAGAAISGPAIFRAASKPGRVLVRLTPVAGEYYGPALTAMMAQARFDTPLAAIRAVKNQRVRFALELASA